MQHNIDPNQYYTVKELADTLWLAYTTVLHFQAQGYLPSLEYLGPSIRGIPGHKIIQAIEYYGGTPDRRTIKGRKFEPIFHA